MSAIAAASLPAPLPGLVAGDVPGPVGPPKGLFGIAICGIGMGMPKNYRQKSLFWRQIEKSPDLPTQDQGLCSAFASTGDRDDDADDGP
jgi:hypothetical protein